MLPAKDDLCPERISMFQQKSRVLVLALLALLSWAPLASAAERAGGGFFDGLMQQLAVFLGLAEEAGPNPLPDGLTGGVPGSNNPTNETGPELTPWG